MPANFLGEVADFAVAQIENNKPAVLAFITQSEGGVEGAISRAIKSAPAPKGALGVIFPMIQNEADVWAQRLVQQFGPEVIFNLIDLELHNGAKALGG